MATNGVCIVSVRVESPHLITVGPLAQVGSPSDEAADLDLVRQRKLMALQQEASERAATRDAGSSTCLLICVGVRMMNDE